MEPLRISVVMPVYNAAPFVAEAVASALALSEVQEVILAEDGSTDGSLAVCEELARKDAKVKLLHHPDGVNKGAGASRNLALEHAAMPWVAFLDADDRYQPDRFAAERHILADHPDAEGVYGAIGVMFHDQEGARRFEGTFVQELTTVRERVPPDRLFAGLVGNIPHFGYFSLDALTISRAALQRMPSWFTPALRLHQDTEFMIRLSYYARLYPGTLDRPVALRGVHRGNRITANLDATRTRLALWRHLEEWSGTVELAAADARTIQARRMQCEIEAAEGRIALVRLSGRFKGRWWLLDRPGLRESYCDALLGRGSWASRVLQKLIWRVLNRQWSLLPRHTA